MHARSETHVVRQDGHSAGLRGSVSLSRPLSLTAAVAHAMNVVPRHCITRRRHRGCVAGNPTAHAELWHVAKVKGGSRPSVRMKKRCMI